MISNIICEKFELIDTKTGIILDDIINTNPDNIICFIIVMCTHNKIEGFNLYDFEPYDTDQNTTYNNFIQKQTQKIEKLEILNKK
jgi:hypothetical protein